MQKTLIENKLPDRPIRLPLSLILCSRNDRYMGNSRWRLQTILNYAAKNIQDLGREQDVEVLVSDWGSEIPLRKVLELTPAAASLVSFIEVPPEVVRDLQGDSPFSDALANNIAARRAGGEYIGRIDQDTLVGRRFLKFFFELYEGKRKLNVPLTSAQLFANQRMVPYRFCVQCPPLWAVDKYIAWFGRIFKIELTKARPYYEHGVGIWLLHRDLWNACGGYDERMIYMNYTEVNMITRLVMKKYELVNLGRLIDYDFYHMEHYHPLARRSSATHRKVNSEPFFSKPDDLNPNGDGWGFAQYQFEKFQCLPVKDNDKLKTSLWPSLKWPAFLLLVLSTGLQIPLDNLIKPFWTGYAALMRRARVSWDSVQGQPPIRWPRILMNLWLRKRSEQR